VCRKNYQNISSSSTGRTDKGVLETPVVDPDVAFDQLPLFKTKLNDSLIEVRFERVAVGVLLPVVVVLVSRLLNFFSVVLNPLSLSSTNLAALSNICGISHSKYQTKPGMGEIEIFSLPALFKSLTILVWISPFELKMDKITREEWL
jgi:hypothetical protein